MSIHCQTVQGCHTDAIEMLGNGAGDVERENGEVFPSTGVYHLKPTWKGHRLSVRVTQREDLGGESWSVASSGSSSSPVLQRR